MTIYVILQLIMLPLVTAGEIQNYEANTNVISSYGNLIYDVTQPLDQNNHSLPENFFDNGHLSSHLYYRMPPRRYLDVPPNLAKYLEPKLFTREFPEICLIFSRNYTNFLMSFLSPNHVSHYPDALLIGIPDLGQTCQIYCSHLRQHFPRFNNTSDVNRLKFGLELNERLLECFEYFCPLLLPKFDVIVLDVNLYPLTQILSFGLFEAKVNKLFKEKAAFVRSFHLRCQFYIRLTMTRIWSTTEQESDLYRAFIADNAENLIRKGIGGRLIIDSYSKSAALSIKASEKAMLISPFVVIHTASKSITRTICEVARLDRVMGSGFTSVIMEIGQGFPHEITTPKCNISKSIGNISEMILPSLILKGGFEHNAEKIIRTLRTHSVNLPLTAVYIDPEHKLWPNFENLRNITDPQNITVGCLHKMQDRKIGASESSEAVTQPTAKYCENMLLKEPSVFLEWLDHLPVDDHHFLASFLDKSLDIRKTILANYPNGKIILKLHPIDTFMHNTGSFRLNIYCVPRLRAMAEFDEAITKWGYIHNLQVVLHPIVDTIDKGGWWFSIVTDAEVNRTYLDFSVFVRRNSPKTRSKIQVLPYTYPCIEWTSSVSNITYSPIKFENHKFSGMTVSLDLPRKSPLTPYEIQTLLCFVFGRFASVEMTRIEGTLEQISQSLGKNLVDALPPNLSLFLEFSDTKLLAQSLKTLNGSDFLPAGIHISNWKSQHNEERNYLNDALSKYYKDRNAQKINFGITVQNCIDEFNSDLVQLKQLTYFKFIRYIVCVVKPVYPSNADQRSMQIYLDTIFYIQQYLNASLGVDTFFRLSFLPLKTNSNIRKETENYLRFLRDLNQHSEGYKLKYFFGDAFASSDSDLWSWWRITDYRDLSDASAYTELESDYFGRRTEQKYKVIPSVENGSMNTIVVLSLSLSSLILFIAVVSLAIYHRRVKRSILSKKEVRAFYHGAEIERNEESVGAKYIKISTVKTLGFNTKFEIPKDKIKLVSKIGGGNFGVVWAGTLRGDTQVAIKVPKENCSKDSFKSMLTEAEILGHIGTHPNVLAFIGAYTKEIENGVIYVVAEFCENGSLENYLRGKKPKPKVQIVLTHSSEYDGYAETTAIELAGLSPEEESVDLNELHRFAFEIASGMNYIAERKILHSDLSTRNVLLTADTTCKIGDFGLSRKLYERNDNEYVKTTVERMPWKWMAPESLTEMRFTSKSDVWSFGVTLWEIYTFGDDPYPGIAWSQDFPEKIQEGLRISKPKHASDEIYAKMLDCCNILPDERPRFSILANYFECFIDIQKLSDKGKTELPTPTKMCRK